MKLKVLLKKNRDLPGTLSIIRADGSIDGEMPCLGRSDNKSARQSGNPRRDPLHRFGDIPTGEYIATIVPSSANEESFGPYERLLLDPVGGDALIAKANGRDQLMIHGGAPGKNPNIFGGLRPTLGCIRVFNPSMHRILTAMRLAGLTRTTLTVEEQ